MLGSVTPPCVVEGGEGSNKVRTRLWLLGSVSPPVTSREGWEGSVKERTRLWLVGSVTPPVWWWREGRAVSR